MRSENAELTVLLLLAEDGYLLSEISDALLFAGLAHHAGKITNPASCPLVPHRLRWGNACRCAIGCGVLVMKSAGLGAPSRACRVGVGVGRRRCKAGYGWPAGGAIF